MTALRLASIDLNYFFEASKQVKHTAHSGREGQAGSCTTSAGRTVARKLTTGELALTDQLAE